jgi:hypothetical protein
MNRDELQLLGLPWKGNNVGAYLHCLVHGKCINIIDTNASFTLLANNWRTTNGCKSTSRLSNKCKANDPQNAPTSPCKPFAERSRFNSFLE